MNHSLSNVPMGWLSIFWLFKAPWNKNEEMCVNFEEVKAPIMQNADMTKSNCETYTVLLCTRSLFDNVNKRHKIRKLETEKRERDTSEKRKGRSYLLLFKYFHLFLNIFIKKIIILHVYSVRRKLPIPAKSWFPSSVWMKNAHTFIIDKLIKKMSGLGRYDTFVEIF